MGGRIYKSDALALLIDRGIFADRANPSLVANEGDAIEMFCAMACRKDPKLKAGTKEDKKVTEGFSIDAQKLVIHPRNRPVEPGHIIKAGRHWFQAESRPRNFSTVQTMDALVEKFVF